MTQISAEKLENYFLILSAIEENLGESKRIKAEINEILCEVSELQEKAKKEGILKNENEPDVTKNRSDDNFVPPQITGGDLMSNLMEMEQGKLFDSRKDTLGSILREGAKLMSTVAQRRNTSDERRKSSVPAKFFQ